MASTFKLAATAPVIGVAELSQPNVVLDELLGSQVLKHHDGHRSVLPTVSDDVIKAAVLKPQLRSDGTKTAGVVSAGQPPSRPYRRQLWFNTVDGLLRTYDVVSDQNDQTGSTSGLYTYDRSTGNLYKYTSSWQLQVNPLDAWKVIDAVKMITGLRLAIEKIIHAKTPVIANRLEDLNLRNDPDYLTVLQRTFEDAMAKAGVVDPYDSLYSPNDPFTWNYSAATSPMIGYTMKGSWRSLYMALYGTTRPDLQPYKLMNMSESSFMSLMVSLTYVASGTTTWASSLWSSSIATYIKNWRTTNGMFARLSVDVPNKILLAPYNATNAEAVFSTIPANIAARFAFGDYGPYELAWRTGSRFIYDELKVMIKLSPSKVLNRIWGYDVETVHGIMFEKSSQTLLTPTVTPLHGDTTVTRPTFGVNVSLNSIPGTIKKYSFQVLNEQDGVMLVSLNDTIIGKTTASFNDSTASFHFTTGYYGFSAGDVVQVVINTDGTYSITSTPGPTRVVSGISQWIIQVLSYHNGAATLTGYDSLMKNWVAALGYRTGGFIIRDTLQVDVNGNQLFDDDLDVFHHVNHFSSGSWLNSLKISLHRRGTSAVQSGVNAPSPGQSGLPGDDWIFRIDSLNPRSSIIRFNQLGGESLTFKALGGALTSQSWNRYLDVISSGSIMAPFLVHGLQNLINFLFGYASYLETKGWVFNDGDRPVIDEDTGRISDWQLEVEKVIAAVYSGIEELQPFRITDFYNKKVWFKTSRGVVDSFEDQTGKLAFNLAPVVLTRAGISQHPHDVRVFRTDDITQLAGNDLSTIRANIAEHDHVVVFDNTTRSNVRMFDSFLNFKQTLIKLAVTKSIGFSGRPEIDGFIGGNVPNVETHVTMIPSIMDGGYSPKIIRDKFYSSYGFDKKSYLTLRGMTEAAQFKFWQSLLKSKGSYHAVDAYLNSPKYSLSGMDDVWAVKMISYGSSGTFQAPGLIVKSDDTLSDRLSYTLIEDRELLKLSQIEAFNEGLVNDDDHVIQPSKFASIYDYQDVRDINILPASDLSNTKNWSVNADFTSARITVDRDRITPVTSRPWNARLTVISDKLVPTKRFWAESLRIPIDGGDRFSVSCELLPVRSSAYIEIVWLDDNNQEISSVIGNEVSPKTEPVGPISSSLYLTGVVTTSPLNAAAAFIKVVGHKMTGANPFVSFMKPCVAHVASTVTAFVPWTDTISSAERITLNNTAIIKSSDDSRWETLDDQDVLQSFNMKLDMKFDIVPTEIGQIIELRDGDKISLADMVIIRDNTAKSDEDAYDGDGYSSSGLDAEALQVYHENGDLVEGSSPPQYTPPAFVRLSQRTIRILDEVLVGRRLSVECYVPAITKHSPIVIEDQKGNKIGDVIAWDPARGLHDPDAISQIDYITDIDPAGYTDSSYTYGVRGQDEIRTWDASKLGKMWWDKTDFDWVNYADTKRIQNLSRRASLWGAPAAYSSVNVYEWFQSDVHPSKHVSSGLDGTPKSQLLVRYRRWQYRTVAWAYSPNPAKTSRDFVKSASCKLYLGNTNPSTTTMTLSNGRFETVGLAKGMKIAHAIYETGSDKTTAYPLKPFGQALITSDQQFVVGSSSSYLNGGTWATNTFFSNFTLVLDQISLRDRIVKAYGQLQFRKETDAANRVFIRVTCVSTGLTQALLIPDTPPLANTTITLKFDQLGFTLTCKNTYGFADTWPSNPTASTTPSVRIGLLGDAIGNSSHNVYLRATCTVDVQVPFIYEYRDTNNVIQQLVTQELLTTSDVPQLAWIGWTDPTTSQLSQDPDQPFNRYQALYGDLELIGPYLPFIEKYIKASLTTPFKLNDGSKVLPYEMMWLPWEPVKNQVKHVILTSDDFVSQLSFIIPAFNMTNDRIKVYLNGHLLRSSQYEINETSTLGQWYVKLLDASTFNVGDRVSIIITAYQPSPVEMQFDPTVKDDPMVISQFKVDYPHVKVQRPNGLGRAPAFSYQYWVTNRSSSPYGKKLSAMTVANLLLKTDKPYAFLQGVKYPDQIYGNPGRYSSIIIDNINQLGLTAGNIVKLGRFEALMNNDEELQIKNIHSEWELIWRNKGVKVNYSLWTKLIDSMIGSDEIGRDVPAASRISYDQRHDTTVKYGVGDGQTLGNKDELMKVIINELRNSSMIIRDVNGNLIADTVTPAWLSLDTLETSLSDPTTARHIMTRLWYDLPAAQLNSIFVAVLDLHFSYVSQISDVMKTSYMIIHDLITVGRV